jgi:hypothetical protein
MRAYLSTHLLVALNTVFVALVVAGSAWYIDYTRTETEMALSAEIDQSVSTITELALTTDRNGADTLTERIVVDCPRRSEFENILQGLGTASRKDLIAAQQLFESCGAFYSERKALMVARLEREFASLNSYLTLLETLRDLTPEEVALTEWGEVVRLEAERSAFLSEQTSIQGEIIALLIEGGNASRINELVRYAHGVGESITETDTLIDAARARLVPQ